jgi:hypothetical protein
MIARTKLQKAIMSEVAKLPSLTAAQAKAAKLHTLPHLAKRTADGYYYCLECGECWKADDTADHVVQGNRIKFWPRVASQRGTLD